MRRVYLISAITPPSQTSPNNIQKKTATLYMANRYMPGLSVGYVVWNSIVTQIVQTKFFLQWRVTMTCHNEDQSATGSLWHVIARKVTRLNVPTVSISTFLHLTLLQTGSRSLKELMALVGIGLISSAKQADSFRTCVAKR